MSTRSGESPARLPTPAPFGSWRSPITAELIAADSIRLGQIAVQGSDIYWTEGRPQEQGRNVLVRCSADGATADLTPAPFDVRSRVHEYGGGAFALLEDGCVFVNDADQQIHRRGADTRIDVLTRQIGMRYADMAVDESRQRLIAVREDHRAEPAEPVNTLVAIDLASGAQQILAEGHDFYSTPRPSPDGRQLAWLSWDHPDMPWDASTLWCAEFDAAGTLGAPRPIAGGSGESIFQPSWSPQGELHFVSDRSGWWNLYRLRCDEVEALQPMAAEFGVPQWAFALSTYGFDAAGRIVCTYWHDGDAQLAVLDPASGSFDAIATAYRDIAELQAAADFAVFMGGAPGSAAAIVRIDLASGEQRVLRDSSTVEVDPAYLSTAEAIRFPSTDGATAHAFFYAPKNRDFCAEAGARPPLIVMTHGGPTGASSVALKWTLQYWTSRGIAVVEVNYRGSSGYGRAYREALKGRWGVDDVDDAVAAARWLVEAGAADADRIAIRGSSAGGYTTLAALTFRDFFKAGTSLYGISDLEALARDTHKFESRYLDGLIGPYPAERERYRARSPIRHTERLNSALLLLQGAEDRVVPADQALRMADAVRAKGLPVAHLLFEGEQHGFRRAATIRRALEAELYFYARVFGFAPADRLAPIAIDNLR